MSLESALISIIILILSVVVHEVSHGLIAEKLGDPTARLAGRLTLNPLPHIDPMGSVLMPFVLYLVQLGSPNPIIFGSAKPVPVNYNNLKNPKRDMVLVSMAGPASNFLLAFGCALPLRLGLIGVSSVGGGFLLQVVILNIVLGVFNLIPIPPLDGSKVLAGFLADRFLPALFSLERYGFFIIFFLLYTGLLNRAFVPLLRFFFRLFLGTSGF